MKKVQAREVCWWWRIRVADVPRGDHPGSRFSRSVADVFRSRPTTDSQTAGRHGAFAMPRAGCSFFGDATAPLMSSSGEMVDSEVVDINIQ